MFLSYTMQIFSTYSYIIFFYVVALPSWRKGKRGKLPPPRSVIFVVGFAFSFYYKGNQ